MEEASRATAEEPPTTDASPDPDSLGELAGSSSSSVFGGESTPVSRTLGDSRAAVLASKGSKGVSFSVAQGAPAAAAPGDRGGHPGDRGGGFSRLRDFDADDILDTRRVAERPRRFQLRNRHHLHRRRRDTSERKQPRGSRTRRFCTRGTGGHRSTSHAERHQEREPDRGRGRRRAVAVLEGGAFSFGVRILRRIGSSEDAGGRAWPALSVLAVEPSVSAKRLSSSFH